MAKKDDELFEIKERIKDAELTIAALTYQLEMEMKMRRLNVTVILIIMFLVILMILELTKFLSF